MSLHYKPVVSRKPFIVARFTCFEEAESGKCSTIPEVPITVCPTGIVNCDNHVHCKVKIICERKRKHPKNLTVLEMYCEAHDLFFTVYPFGYTPYGRQPLVALDSSGNEIDHEKRQSMPSESLEAYDGHMASAELNEQVSIDRGEESPKNTDEITISDAEIALISTFFLQSYAYQRE